MEAVEVEPLLECDEPIILKEELILKEEPIDVGK